MAEEVKRDYQRELKARVADYLERYPYDHGTSDFPTVDDLYEELVRPVALESFRNGRAAGRGVGANPQATRRPRKMAPAKINGTALANGKLRPVAR